MKFNKFSIIIIAFILLATVIQSTSNYKGVSWDENRKLWQAEFYFNGKKNRSYFENELDAAKKVNQLCEEMRIPLKNPELREISNQQKRKWNNNQKKWQALHFSEGKLKSRENFKNELHVRKKVNQLCKEMKIPLQNLEISSISTEKICEEMRISSRNSGSSYVIMPPINKRLIKREKTSQFKGVHWNKERQKWQAQLSFSEGKIKYGGVFNDEINAAKRVNELCEKCKIPSQNPELSAMPTQQYKKHQVEVKLLEQWLKTIKYKKSQKTSQYQGVYWHVESGKWYANLSLNSGKNIYGGIFDVELDAAKKVNELCEESEISLLNPEVDGIHNFSFLSLPPINTTGNKDPTDTRQTIIEDMDVMNASEIQKIDYFGTSKIKKETQKRMHVSKN